MPTLTIDNQTITVPEGTNVLEAAKALGIVIPHFCYHEALGAVGACRICAMTFLDGPVKGMHMSCMVKAQEGMVVSTLEPRAVKLRKHVAEWLMINHPHDCPICDEGGECQLQDMTVAAGHGIRRYRGRKKTYNNQNLGPFLWHEMNRCIQCYRCVRTYQDYCGGTDFGVLGCNQRLYFGRFADGTLESPFAGNLADVCPTGVFTDKPFRYRARYWDLEESPSVCPHCSLGCATVPGARYRELLRVRGGTNRKTNGFFICDRGRFGYGYANHPERPRTPKVDGHETSWPLALSAARDRLKGVADRFGGGSVAFLGSSRTSLEANALLRDWADQLGSDMIAFDSHPRRDRAARVASSIGDKARSLEEVRSSDFVLLVGADPLAEGPMLAIAVRQAVRAGAHAAVLDPRPVELPCEAAHLPILPERLQTALAAVCSGDFSAFDRQESIFLEGIRARLQQAKRPVLVGGADLLGPDGVAALLSSVETLSLPDRPCGAVVLLAGPNSFGGALFAADRPDFDELLDGMLSGEIKALVCLENDPFIDHPDPARARTALSRLELLVVIDSLPGEATRRADIFLPATVHAEKAGTFVNNEGRMLPSATVFRPGIPIGVSGGGGHPPRSFAGDTPGDQPRPAWAVLTALRGRPCSLRTIRREIEERDPRFAGLSELSPGGEGERIAVGGTFGHRPAEVAPSGSETGGSLRLLAVETLFGSERLSSLSPPLAEVTSKPHLLLHSDDAARLGLPAGERVRLTTSLGHFHLEVRVSDRMARGVAILPRLRGTPVEVFVPGAGAFDVSLEKEAP